MNDDLHDIDDLFKKALDQHSELPTSLVWDNIDKSLDKKKVVSISKKYNKLKWAAVILLLFSLGMAMYILHTGIKNKELVKGNNPQRSLQNQPAKDLNSSINEAKKITPPGETVKINEEGKKQEPKNTAPLINAKKIDLLKDKNIADKVRQNNTTAPINTQEKPGETASGNDENNNPVTSIIDINNKRIASTLNHDEKLYEKTLRPKIKYIAEIPVADEHREVIPSPWISPLSPIRDISSNYTNALPYKKAQLNHWIKRGKSTSLSVTLFFSPDLVSTNLKEDDPHFRAGDRHEIKENEDFKFSSTIGALLDFNTGKNWVLESGLTFSTRNSYIRPKIVYAAPDNNGNINYRFNCSAGYTFIAVKSAALPAYGDSAHAFASKNTLQYIGVPLAVKYRITSGRFSLTPGIGFSANFLTKGKIETTLSTVTGDFGASSNDIYGLKSMYFNGSASVGAEYRLNKRIALAFIPGMRFALSSINKDAPVKTTINSIGLAAGVTVKF